MEVGRESYYVNTALVDLFMNHSKDREDKSGD